MGDQARSVDGHALLAVWPPDGSEVQRWIAAAQWALVFLVIHPHRVSLDDSLAEYQLQKQLALTPGRKGPSQFLMYGRAAG